MNPEVKTIWLNALRSGEYTQIQGSLYGRNGDGVACHCALGVLAEEAAKQGIIEIDPKRWGNGRFPDPGTDYLLPADVREWAELAEGFDADELRVMKANDQGPIDQFAWVSEVIENEL